MKRIKLLTVNMILDFLILTGLTIAVKGETKTKSFKVTTGGLLNVDLQSGDINIQTWDKDEILIKVEGLNDEAFKNVEMILKGNELAVTYGNDEDETEDGTSFTFTVPSKFNLNLKTMAGNISLNNNINGNVSVNTYGGEITSKNINGNANIETKGGDIKLDEINGNCYVNTHGGDISINLINSKNAKVTSNGGEINIKKSAYGVNVKTNGGDITMGELWSDSELITFGGNVSVGFAKGNIKMNTYGGDLSLNSAKGNITGKTNAGNINFKKIEGSVDLKTSAGMIEAELNPAANSESKIYTSSGSIELTLPSSAKTKVEARISVKGRWKDSKEDYKINSDFNSESYTTDDKTHDITGTYNINGGGSKIFLRTVNDEIIIKKR